MTNFNIKIVSDTVCPWCYMGKKRLDRAIDLYRKTYPAGKDDTFTIHWSPFYLDPTSPAKGIPVQQMMAQRFGAARLAGMVQQMTALGREEGINFTHEGRVGHTRDSHRLIQLGKTKGADAQSRVVLELFKSYFEGGGDITSHEMLVGAAEKAGLDAAEAKEWLESGKGGPEVDAEVAEAVANNIHGVPHFTIQGTHELHGAQDAQVIMAKFVKIKEGE